MNEDQELLDQLREHRRGKRAELHAAEQYDKQLRQSLSGVIKAAQHAGHDAARVSQRARLDNTAISMQRTADRHTARQKDLKERIARLRTMVRDHEAKVEQLRIEVAELDDRISELNDAS